MMSSWESPPVWRHLLLWRRDEVSVTTSLNKDDAEEESGELGGESPKRNKASWSCVFSIRPVGLFLMLSFVVWKVPASKLVDGCLVCISLSLSVRVYLTCPAWSSRHKHRNRLVSLGRSSKNHLFETQKNHFIVQFRSRKRMVFWTRRKLFIPKNSTVSAF